MGYCTYYTLKVQDYGTGDTTDADIVKAMLEMREKNEYAFYPFDGELEDGPDAFCGRGMTLEPDDEAKWYDSSDEMIALSKMLPDVTFKLHGEGEEHGDIWDMYFKDGKSCEYSPKMPEFNPEDLE